MQSKSNTAPSKAITPIPRKVQRLGASSLIVTLPKEWARRNGVDVGDTVSLIDAGDRLILLPGGSNKDIVVKFDGRHRRVVKHVGRLTICGFIFGQDKIIVESPRVHDKGNNGEGKQGLENPSLHLRGRRR